MRIVTTKIVCLIFCSIFATQLAWAQSSQQWWFDIEVILFKRNVNANEVAENFGNAPQQAPRADMDLLSDYLYPDIQFLQQAFNICPFDPQSLAWPEIQQSAVEDALAAQNDETVHQAASTTADSQDTSYKQNSTDEYLKQSDTVVENALDTDSNESIPAESPTPQFFEENPAQTEMAYQHLVDTWLIEQVANLPKVSLESECLSKEQWMNTSPIAYRKIRQNVPNKINGPFIGFNGQAELLPENELSLHKLYKDIVRQRSKNPELSLRPLLHLGWRQEVEFGEDNAPSMRLMAGKNYADEFLPSGQAIALTPSESDEIIATTSTEDDVLFETGKDGLVKLQQPQLFFVLDDANDTTLESEQAIQNTALQTEPAPLNLIEKIRLSLAGQLIDAQKLADVEQEAKVEHLWQLDGAFKVYLKYINRVPYLHINSQLLYRLPATETELANMSQSALVEASPMAQTTLRSYPFMQIKRVISKELHYFDHPLFGMVVQIRRFRPPVDSGDNE